MNRQHSSDTDDFRTYVEAVLDVLATDTRREVITTAEGTVLHAGELRDRVLQLAAALGALGVGRGTTVALLTGNTAEAIIARYAANLAGAVVVGLSEGTSLPVMAELMKDADCSVLLVDGRRQDDAAGLTALTGARPFSLGPSAFAPDVLDPAAALHPQPTGAAAAPSLGPEDAWRIGHTGGTTGVPKGIRMTHGSHRRGLDEGPFDAGDPPRFLVCTSLSHLAGLLVDRTLHRGGSVVLRHGFEPGDVLATLEREAVTHVWLLPPLLYELLDHPRTARTDLSALRRITYGGTAASPSRLREAGETLGPVLHGWYGQAETQLITESGPGDVTRTGQDGRPTVGRPLPEVEVAVRGADGTTLPAGERGEVHVRSPHVMAGYVNRPEETAEVLRDGWVRTGDVGHLDEEGYLYLVDRVTDRIVLAGGHVYPAELEELLLRHPAIARCTVFGSRDDESVEHVHLAVVPAAGERPDLAEIRRFVTERRGALHAPETLHVLPAVPLTPAGKPDRQRLRSLLAG